MAAKPSLAAKVLGNNDAAVEFKKLPAAPIKPPPALDRTAPCAIPDTALAKFPPVDVPLTAPFIDPDVPANPPTVDSTIG